MASSSSVLQPTPVDEIPSLVSELRATFLTHKTRAVAYRKAQLKALYRLLDENFEALAAAIHKDVRKNKLEFELTETGMVKSEIVDMIENLDSWAAPEKPSVPTINKLDGCQIRRDPLGVVVIIGAWNYPIQLTLLPAVNALAAGNCVILKPSEIAQHTAQALGELVPKYMDPQTFRVVNGGVAETTKLLEQRSDFILYTGNSQVAKIIMSAAAKHLTPVGLELGGKSPTIVLDDADVVNAARRIAWGRYSNAGQTCISPDYVLCSAAVEDRLVEQIQAAVKEFYGEDPQKSDSYGRIVNANHFKRVSRLLTDAKVAMGGNTDEADLYIAPTVLSDVKPDSSCMKEEIFGPVLPIVRVSNAAEAISFINEREKPLALYVFGRSGKEIEKILQSTSSGSAVVNDTLVQASVPQLPFGGVGHSGMGAYHGKNGFELFSHKKSTMIKDSGLEFVNAVRYPPYTEKKSNIIKRLLFKTLHHSNLPLIGGIGAVGAAVALTAYLF